jgi:glycosyl transferase family 2
MRAHSVELEFILPVCNCEDDIAASLGDAVAGLRGLAVPAGVAVVDSGSSDRTLERVDRVAAGSPVPIRTAGCSRPGWAAAALRGIATTTARWVLLGETGALAGGSVGALDHAVRMLAGGRHMVCPAVAGGRITLLDPPTATLVVGDQAPDGPGFVPELPDTVDHAGVRLAAVGRVAAPTLSAPDVESTVLLDRVGV